ncbi:peptidylprolyl isomerase SurA [Alteromonas flava]|uniref:peptidylprolyl isomerase SurA n=1 Tax=Alteromonas flava TaxID=2048003 RepID=UPI000C28B96F|nr:peptidylprolyl isomerase SurA [Alteromonas flava]
MKKLLIALAFVLSASHIHAQETKLDSVAVIVDQGVILESEIQELISNVKRNAIANDQSLPSDRALRTQAIERLILTNLQMQMADRMGIRISDPQLDQTIRNIAQSEGMTLEQLRSQVALEGISYEQYRESVRQELITGEVTRANVRRRIYITPQEINTLVDLIDQQGAQQAEYQLGHILIGFPPQASDDDIAAAKDRAERVIELLESGSDFAKIAIASSSGSEALEGGNMGWMNINSMPTLFAEAVQSKRKDSLVGPIRSGAGFHILKVLDTRGIETVEVEEVNARHILITPSIILSEEKAEEMLNTFKQQIIDGEKTFEELAKEHSEDPGSALRGGELGFTDPNVYVPVFRDTLATLQPGEFSKPVRSQHGWHLIQLIERRMDDATERRKEDKAYQLIFNRKFSEETDSWLREMRDAAYIEIVGGGNA